MPIDSAMADHSNIDKISFMRSRMWLILYVYLHLLLSMRKI